MRIGIFCLAVAISASVSIHSAHSQDKPRVVVIPLIDDCDEAEKRKGTASTANVLAGKTFSNDSASDLTGSMPNRGAVSITPGASNQSIPAGYHNGAGSCAGDADLAAENIKSGVEIFGTTGTVIEASGDAAASQVLSGETFSTVSSAGLTGTMPDKEGDNVSVSQVLEAGVIELTAPIGFYDGDDTVTATEAQIAALEANLVSENVREGTTIFGVSGNWGYFSSPSPRFTDNGDGTITDNLTNVIWMREIDCFPRTYLLENLYDGSPLAASCGLSDGSMSGDWRDPTVKELVSLADYRQSPRLPVGHPFTNVGNWCIKSSDVRYNGGPWLEFDLKYGMGCETAAARGRWPVRSEQ